MRSADSLQSGLGTPSDPDVRQPGTELRTFVAADRRRWRRDWLASALPVLAAIAAAACSTSTLKMPTQRPAEAISSSWRALARSTPPLPTLDARVDAALAEAAKQRAFSGVALVASGDRLVSRVNGFADASRERPITEQSRFAIGSLSKSVTASLVMREVEAGRVRLEDPIGRYLELGVPWGEKVQVKHLLNHTSGIKAIDEPLAREPGTSFEYSNLGYDLLGRLVVHTSGRSFPEAVQGLFESCEITASGTLASAGESLVAGFGESADGALTAVPVPPEVKEHLPSGGLVASADEFMRWTRCLQSGRAVSPKSYERMTTPATTRSHRWGVLGYGFGLQILEADGLLELSHSGYIPGFVSTVLIYPKRCVTVVLLENVATPVSDMKRAFAPHDAIRGAVRQALMESRTGLGCTAVASPAP